MQDDVADVGGELSSLFFVGDVAIEELPKGGVEPDTSEGGAQHHESDRIDGTESVADDVPLDS